MTKKELNLFLKNKDLELNIFDIRNGVTKKLKKQWAIQKIIEEHEKCINCNNLSLVDCDLEGNLLLCSNCGYISTTEEYIK